MQANSDIPFLDLASPDFSTRSADVHEARAANWFARTPYGIAVLRHREVGLLLRDKRLRQGSYAWPDTNGLQGSFADFWKRSIISQEGGHHRRLRDFVVPVLSPELIAAMSPSFNVIAEHLADTVVAAGSVEFMSEFAEPFAGQAICLLLGLGTDQWTFVARNAANLGLAMGVTCKRHEDIFNASCDALMDLAEQLIARARHHRDGDGFIERLVQRHEQFGDLSGQHLKDMIVIAIFGGVDTTRSQLGLAMSLFIDHPDQWRHLRSNPDLVPRAIEEIIAFRPTTTWATREAIDDIEFQGEVLRRGETVHLLVHASARDPAICPEDRFDISARRKIHFGFGGGAHHCIGHLMARTDMAAALRALASRVSRISYAGTPRWLPESGNTSPEHLPLRLDAAPRIRSSRRVP